MAHPELKHILDVVNGWLRFAESKNGVLLALTVSAATAGREIGMDSTCCLVHVLRFGFIALMFTAAGFCLSSFVPRLVPSRVLGEPGNDFDDFNIIYFGSVATASKESLERVIKGVLNEDRELNRLERAYTDQILVNSRITAQKLRLFTWAIRIASVGLTCLAALVLLNL